MIETKLIKGRYLNWNIPGTQNAATGNAGDFVTHPPKPLMIEMSQTHKSMRQSNVLAGANLKKDWRNFQWLDYYPLRTSWVPLGTTDLLTGRMTGCYVVVYDDNGTVKVAHVGTETSKPAENTQLKNAWNAFAASPGITIIKGFKPSDSVQAVTGPKGFSQLFIIGGVTVKQDLFTLVLFGQGTPGAGNTPSWYIADLVNVTQSLPLSQLTNL
jgi:hypothetical protein